MSNWRHSRVVAVALIAAFLVVQLAIPIERLFPQDSPNRWAWQMFSRTPRTVQLVVHTAADTTEIDLHDYMAQVRGDIDVTAVMPPHLCEVRDDAVRITWDSGEFEC